MDTIMTVLAQVVWLAVLLVYFAVIGTAAYAVGWMIYHTLHHQWTRVQTWREARARNLWVAR